MEMKENSINQVKDNEEISSGDHNYEVILGQLISKGSIQKENGFLVADVEKIKKDGFELFTKTGINIKENLSQGEIFKILHDINVYSKEEIGQIKKNRYLIQTQKPKSLISFPENFYEAVLGKMNNGHILPWELGEKSRNIPLEFDEQHEKKNFSLAELYISHYLNKFLAVRDGNGELFITDPRDNKRKSFSLNLLTDILGTGKLIRGGVDKRNNLTVINLVKNLIESKILKKEDFGYHSRSNLEKFGPKKKFFNKSNSASYFGFSRDGQLVRYYIGKEKIIGTDTLINKDTMNVIQLDEKTIGILEDNFGKTKLLFTIDLLPGTESSKIKEKFVDRLTNKGEDLNPKKIASGVIVNAPQMEKLIRKYNLKEYLPEWLKNNIEDNLDIVSNLNDIGMVIEGFRELAEEAGIGTLQFSWGEQITLASILSNQNIDSNNLRNFVKKYKEGGLKTFISIIHGGKEMGDKILTLGEKLPEQSASKIFTKYGEIVDVVENIIIHLKESCGEACAQDPEIISKIREQMLLEGKNFLKKIDISDDNTDLLEIEKYLERFKMDIVIFKNIFKAILSEEKDFSIKDFSELSLNRTYSSEQIKPKEYEEMKEIIERNYKDKPELKKIVLQSFNKSIEEGYNYTNFFLLKRNGKIIGFDRFDYEYEGKSGHAYFGSFNIDPEYCNSKLGGALFETTINESAQNFILHADCSPRDIFTMKYISSGFVGIKLFTTKEGVEGMKIIRDDNNTSYKYNSTEIKDILLLFNENKESILMPDNTIIEKHSSLDTINFSYLNNGYALTRYEFVKNDKNGFYVVVFEKNN